MNKRRIALLLSIGGAVALGIAPRAASVPPPDEVATVSFLEGRAWIRPPNAKVRKELELFDWIKIGSLIDTETDARIIVAFASGTRYELKGPFAATVEADGFKTSAKAATKLPPVAVMPRFAALVLDNKSGSRMAGIRLRSAPRSVSDLYPGDGDAVPADQAVISFGLFPDVGKYRVEVEDDAGNDVYSAVTPGSPVVLPPGILKPGRVYYLSVRTLETKRVSARADTIFAVITEEQAGLREALKLQADQSKGAADRLLLAQLEMTLGLQKEACASLKSALVLQPENAAIRRILAQWGCR